MSETNKCPFDAYGDKVILRPIKAGEEMYESIIIPDQGKERPETGEVIAVGPGRITEFGTVVIPSVNIGDILLVPRIGTLRVDYQQEEYYIVPDREILAKINIKEDNEQ